MRAFALFIAILLSVPGWAQDCRENYRELARLLLTRPSKSDSIEELIEALPDAKRQAVRMLFWDLPDASSLPVWLRSVQERALFWRRDQVAEVIDVLLRDEKEWGVLYQVASSNPLSLTLAERRAVMLRISQKWWFNEDVEFTRGLAASIARVRPSTYLASQRLPFEDLLHNRNSPAFWKSLLRLQASTREIAEMMSSPENRSGRALLSRLLEKRGKELDSAIQESRGIRKSALQHEKSRLELLSRLLKRHTDEWAAEIETARASGLLSTLRETGERLVGDAADLAAFGLLSYLLYSGTKFMSEKLSSGRESVDSGESTLYAPAVSAQLRKRSVELDSELARAMRDYNEGKITLKELRKVAPELFTHSPD